MFIGTDCGQTEKLKVEDDFSYLIKKIEEAEICYEPFPHLEIQSFLSPEHFQRVIGDAQVHFEGCLDTEHLIESLHQTGYEEVNFPGCTTNIQEYLRHLKDKSFPVDKQLLEGYGVTFRLTNYRNEFIRSLISFMNSPEYQSCLENKFGIRDETLIFSAIQKNLTGYEISPHPDTRNKALTYLLNINKDDTIENYDVHTHLMKFVEERKYIQSFWETEKEFDRCWVPWSWCKTVKRITKNNTIMLFSPCEASIHAIKLDYPHCEFQRTQIYGNLWFKEQKNFKSRTYQQF